MMCSVSRLFVGLIGLGIASGGGTHASEYEVDAGFLILARKPCGLAQLRYGALIVM